MEKITGILLAGGRSSRMGSDKGLLDFRGRLLAEYPLALLQKHCGTIIISSNNPEYGQFGYPVVADERMDCGPAGALATTLKQTNSNWNLVLACDLPYLNDELAALLLRQVAGEAKAIVPVHRKGMEPLAALYHKDLQPVFGQALHEGVFALHRILSQVPTLKVDAAQLLQQQPRLFSNMNSPEELSGFTQG